MAVNGHFPHACVLVSVSLMAPMCPGTPVDHAFESTKREVRQENEYVFELEEAENGPAVYTDLLIRTASSLKGNSSLMVTTLDLLLFF